VGDITDKASLTSICYDADVVFHLASYVHKIPKSEEEKRYVFNVNVDGTRNLLDSLGHSVRHIVFFSSVSVYGLDSGFDIDESVKTEPVTLYGITKLKGETLIRDWGEYKHVKTTCLRLPLVYGSGNKGNIDKMIQAIKKNLFMIIGDGSNKRSLVYVRNVVDAALAVVDRQKTNSEVYIITDGIDYTVKELYVTIAKGMEKKPLSFRFPLSIANGLAWLGDMGGGIIGKPLPFNSETLKKLTGSLTFSSRKIQEEMGFKPTYNLYNAISEVVNRIF
jgi:nucleoside-diphosphate-sugar epimerase